MEINVCINCPLGNEDCKWLEESRRNYEKGESGEDNSVGET